GLLDMAGNVFEWCENLYEGQSNVRVIRGGAYNMDASWVGCASRLWVNQGSRDANLGFRVVRP
ncbi:MAG: SUMF1/EgtB/PvdO family nonheme iron enzyme, partial [Anaerolineae bacterium]